MRLMKLKPLLMTCEFFNELYFYFFCYERGKFSHENTLLGVIFENLFDRNKSKQPNDELKK